MHVPEYLRLNANHKITQIFIRNLRLNGKSFKVEKTKYKARCVDCRYRDIFRKVRKGGSENEEEVSQRCCE